MQTVFSVKELAKRWSLTPNTIRRMEIEGKLHRLPNLPGVRYAAAEVCQLESIGIDAQPLTAYERRQLENRVKELEELVSEYQLKLTEIMMIAGGINKLP